LIFSTSPADFYLQTLQLFGVDGENSTIFWAHSRWWFQKQTLQS
jgi:hypothetical protein